MRRSGAGLHTLVGAYVMDAVPDTDRVAFERHLAGCEQCREEVRGLREATARMAKAAAIEPRAELRQRTLLAASRMRQLPPLVAPQKTRSLAGWLVPRKFGSGPTREGHWWLATIAVAAAVVCAVAVIGLGLHMSSMRLRLSAVQARDHAIAAVLGAPDATTLTAQVRTGGTATVVMSHHVKELVFTASKLSVLPPSRAYELWLMGPSGATAAGMLPPAHGGMSGPMVVTGLAPGDRLCLTVEPAAGARQPTSSPIVLVGLGI